MATNRRKVDNCWKFALGVAVTLCIGRAVTARAIEAHAQESIPDFSSNSAGWIAQGVNFQLPPNGPHQVTSDPLSFQTAWAGRGTNVPGCGPH